MRRVWTALIVLLTVLAGCAARPADPLPSWNPGAARDALVSFVERTTKDGSPDFIPPPERIAVFDNDGTLWPENPIPFQAAFAADEINRMVAAQPELENDPMVRALLDKDTATLLAGPKHEGLLRIIALTHTDMSTTDFAARANTWIGAAVHPRFARPYDRLTYLPMQDVMRYLRDHGYKTFIVSGGGATSCAHGASASMALRPSRWSARPVGSPTNCATPDRF